jgi:uncharacterized ferritin-like protein (DUF455 family)
MEIKQPFQNILTLNCVRQKLAVLDDFCQRALTDPSGLMVPTLPGRDAEVLHIRQLPPKPGLAGPRGQARLLHDLANIELQAMEMAFRTLIEFPHAPPEFRLELAAVAREEGLHLKLCLDMIGELGCRWGEWPVHLGLWTSLDVADSLLDRILIVHRYLEGSGLDAGETIRRRLSGVAAAGPREVTERIAHDEIAHVEFGSRWYREICRREKLDPAADFEPRLKKLFHRLPRRLEPIASRLRKQSGFSDGELATLSAFQEMWRGPAALRVHLTHS